MSLAGRLKTLEVPGLLFTAGEREPMLGEKVTLVPWAAPDTGVTLQLQSHQRTLWIIFVQDRVVFHTTSEAAAGGTCPLLQACHKASTPQAFKEKKPSPGKELSHTLVMLTP